MNKVWPFIGIAVAVAVGVRLAPTIDVILEFCLVCFVAGCLLHILGRIVKPLWHRFTGESQTPRR